MDYNPQELYTITPPNFPYEHKGFDRTEPLYRQIASTIVALQNCKESGNTLWEENHTEALDFLEQYLPSGSGLNAGTTIDRERSTGKKLIFITSFHHMHESGVYDGWTEHDVIVTPSFDGIDVRVTGRDRNQIKDYLAEMFWDVLANTHVSWNLRR